MVVSNTRTAELYPGNSTTDHAIAIPIPGLIRLAYRVAASLSPHLGGELARRIFFHPPRLPFSKRQQAILDEAERHELGGSSGRIVSYSWGKGPVVLLVHGWGGHSGQMTGFVRPLLDDGFRVVAVDLPAHGRSAGGLSSLVHFSEAMHIAAHVHEPVYGVITHSLGGAGLVRALLNGFSARRAVLIAPPAQLGGYWRAFQNSLGMSEAVWAAMVLRSERWLGVRFADLHPRLGAPKMKVPALILHGASDRMSPLSEGRELARLWPGARISEFADTGHVAILRDETAIRMARGFMTS